MSHDEDIILGEPHYFGPTERRRFSFVHWPTGAVRGGVLICPPLAYEAVCAHPTLRILAEQFAARGIVAMRIDYDGTSNSIGDDRDAGRLEAWADTLSGALDELRSFGLTHVQILGLRFGATLAAAAMADCPDVDAMVLWDPVVSGRRYGREMRLMSAASGLRPDPRCEGISIAGVQFSEQTLKEMSKVTLAPIGPRPCLVVERAERSSDGDPAISRARRTDVEQLLGTAAMLDTDAELAVVPTRILASIVTWVDRQMPARADADARVDKPTLVAEAFESVDGETLRHCASRVGPCKLFAVETTLAQATATRAVVMLNNGVAAQIGPGRAWVEFAARLARHGFRVVRLDISGLGDSPPHPGQPSNESYPPFAADDITDLVVDLVDDGIVNVAAIGLCSGALLAFDGALARSEIDCIISINGRFDRPFFDARQYRARRAARPTNKVISVPLRKTPLLRYFAKVPSVVWSVLDRTHLVAAPTVAIGRVVDQGRKVLLIFGDGEWGLVALQTRDPRRWKALLGDRRLTVCRVPGLDHSMFDLAARDKVLDVVTDYLTGGGPTIVSSESE